MFIFKILKSVGVIPLIFIVYSISFAIDFTPTEIMVIPWGDGPNELMKTSPEYEDNDNTPEDSTDDFIYPEAGPDRGFVDRYENVYFGTYHHNYFKGFNSNGGVMVDYYRGETDSGIRIYSGKISGFYVDSLMHIYIVSFPGQDFISVVDTANNFIDSLRPPGLDEGVRISKMYYNSDGVLSFLCSDRTRYTYMNGVFLEGGKGSWRATNGIYYWANNDKSGDIRFITHTNPDIYCDVTDLQEYFVPYPEELHYVSLLGVDDSMLLYVYVGPKNTLRDIIQVYDTTYTLVGEIVPYTREKWEDIDILSYLRPDGNVYEFRCLEDGLHVIRWVKEE